MSSACLQTKKDKGNGWNDNRKAKLFRVFYGHVQLVWLVRCDNRNDKFVDVEIKIDARYMYLTQATLLGRVLESDPEDIVRNIEIKDFNQSFVIQIPQ